VFPELIDRFRPMAVGDSLDLGGTEFVIVEAVFRDYIYTRWGFDTRRRILFTGDGFAYSHYHAAGQCGQVAEEVPELDLPDMTSLFSELAFTWTRYVDIEPYIERLDELLFDELKVETVAPTHGLPITDPKRTMAAVRHGLRLGSESRTTGSVT
jgi:flavorubredoxin